MTVDPVPTYALRWERSMDEIDRAQWDALATPLQTPLLEWEWLRLMEASGSIVPKNGWMPHHLTVWDGPRLVAAAPLYVKGHSAGEFVFDHAWAELAGQLKIAYYPKMIGMSPVTPVSGYRFLVASDVDEAVVTRLMVAAIDRFCSRHGLSGCSFLFVDPEWRPLLEDCGYVGWRHQSYRWKNAGFTTFDDYLARFNSNQRRNIKRERRSLEALGIEMRVYADDAIPDAFFPLMYRFYERTNDSYGPWGCKYLTREFFTGLRDRYRRRLVFAAAFEEANGMEPIGMSLLLRKGNHLYGRYWGSSRHVHHLHFNACYYGPIEWAIANGIQDFDPGAGSPHKVRRGFEAVSNYSLHRFYDRRLGHVLRTYIDEINRMEQEQIDALNRQLPFARENGTA